ncbi:MAG: glycosyltransferase [Blastocatellales bacterium]
MPITTLHITSFYHQTSGGISTFYRALLESANRLRRRMVLVVPGDQTRLESVGDYGRIHYLRSPRAPFFDRRYRLLTPQTYLPLWRGDLNRVLRDEKPDLVEINDKYSANWLAGLLRRRWLSGMNRPVLVGISCERMDDNVRAFLNGGNLARRLSQAYLGNLHIPLFDYHIANSDYTAEELISAMNPKHRRPVRVLPMGAQVEDFAAALPDESKRRQLIALASGNKRSRLLLYAGRLSPEKNIPLLLEMIERLADDGREDFRLIVAGSGPLADWFESEACRRAPGKIVLLGHVRDRQSLVGLYANCDAFVHPNPREPFGIAPLEAMAAGLPLVAPRSGGVLSYADDTNSWLADANAESFAAAVSAVFSDASASKDRLARARWVARQYRWPDVAENFFSLYDELHADFQTSRFAPRPEPKPQLNAAGTGERIAR